MEQAEIPGRKGVATAGKHRCVNDIKHHCVHHTQLRTQNISYANSIAYYNVAILQQIASSYQHAGIAQTHFPVRYGRIWEQEADSKVLLIMYFSCRYLWSISGPRKPSL